MLSRILRTIAEHSLLPPGARVLAAVSGGPDSTALVSALAKLAPRLRITVRAAAVDHGLRPESAAEAQAVLQACAALDIPCEVVRVDVAAARGRHVSWQEAARNARLAALEQVAGRRGCSRIALGHTADDQAETVLFRIVRGTGVVGLAGMPYARGPFVRPLLDVRRREVLGFLEKRKIAFFEDPSNSDRRYARSRVRHDWLPLLARDNPRIAEALLALAADARRLSMTAASPARGRDLSRRAAATVARLAAAGAGTRRVSVRGGQVAVSYGSVSFEPRGHVDPPAPVPPVAVPGPGVYRLGNGPALAIDDRRGGGQAAAGRVAFDAVRIARPLVLRSLRPGERMRPRGGRGSRKLSDLLVDAKIPRDLRRLLPALVAADGTILFVPGLRPSDVGRPTRRTRRWLEVRVVDAA